MRPTITIFALLLISNSVVADDASHRAAAVKFLEASRAAEMIDQVYDSMLPQLTSMTEQMGIEEAQRPIFERHMERVFQVMREEMNWEKIEPYMIDAYVDVYTEDELLELAVFYESPLGQKFIAKMPELMNKTMQMTQSMMGGFYARIEELQAELQADLAKSRAEN